MKDSSSENKNWAIQNSSDLSNSDSDENSNNNRISNNLMSSDVDGFLLFPTIFDIDFQLSNPSILIDFWSNEEDSNI